MEVLAAIGLLKPGSGLTSMGQEALHLGLQPRDGAALLLARRADLHRVLAAALCLNEMHDPVVAREPTGEQQAKLSTRVAY